MQPLKPRPPIAVLVLVLCAACAGTGETRLAPVEFSEQAMMDRWMAFMTPGPAHRVLDYKAGTWDLQVTMYMPDGSAATSTGTSRIEWVMDGRYLVEHVTGSFQGMPFEGTGTMGYDNLRQRYVNSWIDNMGTGIMFGVGTFDAANHTLSYDGEGPDVLRGCYVPVRSVETQLDARRWKAEMWGPAPDGTTMKSMELLYTRRP